MCLAKVEHFVKSHKVKWLLKSALNFSLLITNSHSNF